MSGYRVSNVDLNAPPSGGRPMRPYNWVQWTGVAMILAAIAVDLAFFAGRAGLIRFTKDTPTFANVPLILGIALINSRREPIVDQAPELAAARRRWLAIVTAICAVVLGVATIFALKGY